MDLDFLVILHRIYMNGKRKEGGVDIIIEHLIQQNNRVGALEFQLGGKYIQDTEFERNNTYSVLRGFENGGEFLIREFNVYPKAEPARWIAEVLYAVFMVFAHVRGRIPFCIASDPLNTFSAWILRLSGKVRKIYFHSVDYSDRRFKNRLLDDIYHFLYRFAVGRADLVGVVSSRMMQKCLELGIDKDKLIFVPNTPDFDKIPRLDISKRELFTLVVSSASVVKKYRFEYIVDTVSKLKKEFPGIKLKILGDTGINKDYFEKLKKKIAENGLEENIRFLGYLPKERNLAEIASSTIGIALYSEDTHYYMYYADPLKIREYAACGVPIITDNTTTGGSEAVDNGAGFVCNKAEEIADAIGKLWNRKELYEEYCLNAIKWAKKFEKKTILKHLFQRLG